MGAQRRQHHAREQAKRDAAAEANRIRQMQEEADARMKALADALKPKAEQVVEAPRTVRSTIDDTRVGVRTAGSRRKSVTATGRGIAALRIPLNLGGGGDSGLNIG